MFVNRHIATLLNNIRFASCNKSSFGSYRVEIVVLLFDRIIDLHNFECISMVLNAEEQAAIIARIGMFLNTWFVLIIKY